MVAGVSRLRRVKHQRQTEPFLSRKGVSMTIRPAHILTAISSILVIIAALLPWAKVDTAIGSKSVSGIEGDGIITLVLGIGALAAIAVSAYGKRWGAVIATILGGIVAIVGIIDWADVGGVTASVDTGFASVSVGAGLVLTAIGGVALTVTSLWAFFSSKQVTGE